MPPPELIGTSLGFGNGAALPTFSVVSGASQAADARETASGGSGDSSPGPGGAGILMSGVIQKAPEAVVGLKIIEPVALAWPSGALNGVSAQPRDGPPSRAGGACGRVR